MAPAGRSTGELDQQAKKDEERAMNGAGKMNGIVVALDSLEKDGAVEKHEKGSSLQQSHEA